jgi:hypothetical protein
VLENCEFYKPKTITNRGANLGLNRIYDAFKVGIVEGDYLPEDFYFCKLLQKVGIKVYSDSAIVAVHNGNAQFLNKNQGNTWS